MTINKGSFIGEQGYGLYAHNADVTITNVNNTTFDGKTYDIWVNENARATCVIETTINGTSKTKTIAGTKSGSLETILAD